MTRLTFVVTEAMVEHTVNQNDWPYVNPSSKRPETPNIVTAIILIISGVNHNEIR